MSSEHVPGRLVGEQVDAVGRRLCAGEGACLHALLALDAEADQRADLATELDRLVLASDC